jgi:hypothetical protein
VLTMYTPQKSVASKTTNPSSFRMPKPSMLKTGKNRDCRQKRDVHSFSTV